MVLIFSVCALSALSVVAQSKVTLRYLERMRVEEWGQGLYDRLAVAYEELNPDVKIEYISISYANQRQQTLMRGQAGTIDISEPVVSWIPQLAEANILESVEEYFTQEELDSQEIQGEIQNLRVDMKKADVWLFRMLLEMFDVGVENGLWNAGDFSTEIKQKAAAWKTKLNRLLQLGDN